jgi:short-subunit dehydrogenase
VGTALVTGASAGIGRSFAQHLAARGHGLVLVARDGPRLEALAIELRAAHNTHIEVLPADLLTDDGLVMVTARLADTTSPVDLLVNNAGIGAFGPFVDADIDAQVRQIELNVVALVRCTHAALQAMYLRGNGAILNVSSLAGFQPAPNSATYAATKAFVNSFTHSVHEEAHRRGVHVMAVCPGFTHTEFHERAGIGTESQLPEVFWQSADAVVGEALGALDRRRSVAIPGGINKVVGALSSITPSIVSRRIAGVVIRRT